MLTEAGRQMRVNTLLWQLFCKTDSRIYKKAPRPEKDAPVVPNPRNLISLGRCPLASLRSFLLARSGKIRYN